MLTPLCARTPRRAESFSVPLCGRGRPLVETTSLESSPLSIRAELTCRLAVLVRSSS